MKLKQNNEEEMEREEEEDKETEPADGKEVHAVILSKERFDKEKDAVAWCDEQGYRTTERDSTDDAWAFTQRPKRDFDPETFEEVEVEDGVHLMVGILNANKPATDNEAEAGWEPVEDEKEIPPTEEEQEALDATKSAPWDVQVQRDRGGSTAGRARVSLVDGRVVRVSGFSDMPPDVRRDIAMDPTCGTSTSGDGFTYRWTGSPKSLNVRFTLKQGKAEHVVNIVNGVLDLPVIVPKQVRAAIIETAFRTKGGFAGSVAGYAWKGSVAPRVPSDTAPHTVMVKNRPTSGGTSVTSVIRVQQGNSKRITGCKTLPAPVLLEVMRNPDGGTDTWDGRRYEWKKIATEKRVPLGASCLVKMLEHSYQAQEYVEHPKVKRFYDGVISKTHDILEQTYPTVEHRYRRTRRAGRRSLTSESTAAGGATVPHGAKYLKRLLDHIDAHEARVEHPRVRRFLGRTKLDASKIMGSVYPHVQHEYRSGTDSGGREGGDRGEANPVEGKSAKQPNSIVELLRRMANHPGLSDEDRAACQALIESMRSTKQEGEGEVSYTEMNSLKTLIAEVKQGSRQLRDLVFQATGRKV